MTNEEQRFAIAQTQGWQVRRFGRENYLCPKGEYFLRWEEPIKGKLINHLYPTFGDYKNLICPNYPEDLNACHEMQRKLTPDECLKFCDWLGIIVRRKNPEGTWDSWILKGKINATPDERCEAFLRTKGLWIEKEKV